MDNSLKTVLGYAAALTAALLLHAGAAKGLQTYLKSDRRNSIPAETVQPYALSVSMYRPPPDTPYPKAGKSAASMEQAKAQPEPADQTVEPQANPAAKTARQSAKSSMSAEAGPVVQSDLAAQQHSAPAAGEYPHNPWPRRSEGPVRPAVQTTKPRPLQPLDIEAVYPIGARLRGEEGAIRLLLHIGSDGRLRKLDIEESSGFAALDRAAEQAIRRTRFAPATRNNRPVPGELTITIRFSLDN